MSVYVSNNGKTQKFAYVIELTLMVISILVSVLM